MFDRIIISCGAAKVPLGANQKIEAYKLYDGGFYKQMLNLAVRLSPQVYILSAAYGILSANDLVETYDLKMNPKIAKWMREKSIAQFDGASLLGSVYASAVTGNLIQILPTVKMGYKIQLAQQKAKDLPVLCNLESLPNSGRVRRIVTPDRFW